MDNRTDACSDRPHLHHQPDLHRKGRDSGYSVDGHNPHDPAVVPTAKDGDSPDSGSGLRRVINKLNPLHRSPSPSPSPAHGHTHGGAVSGGSVGIPGATSSSSSSSSNRPTGLSSVNPNIPGEDNRTLGEKARDKLDPRRHPDQNQSQLSGGYTTTSGSHHSHTVGGEHANHHGHTKEAALGMAAVAGAGGAAYKHHEHQHPHELGREHGHGHGLGHHREVKSSDPYAYGQDDRSALEKAKDKVDPRVKADRREAQVTGTGVGVGVGAGHSAEHPAGHPVWDLEHSLRETRLANDNPAQVRDDRAVPYAADSTDTLGQRTGGPVSGSATGSGLGSGSGPGPGLSHHHRTSRFAEGGDMRSPAAGGLHVSDHGAASAGQQQQYRPDVAGENDQPGYSIPPAERHDGRDRVGSQDQQQGIPPVHATGLRAEGGDFDASRPGAGSEARRLMEQAEKTGSSLDPEMR